MRIVVFLCFLAGITRAQEMPMDVNGQVRGKIQDAATGAPLRSVNAYINHTTLGATTDADGSFVITNIPAGDHELIVSIVGYRTYRRKVVVKNENPIHTTLQLLKSVANTNASSTNTAQLNRFSRFLFGTKHIDECVIQNPEVLDLTTAGSALSVTARAPLQLVNNYLGYTIYFLLNQFELDSSGYALSGDAWFQSMESTTTQQVTNRLSAYAGSAEHFFKSIAENKVEENGFKVYADRSKTPRITRSPEFNYNLAHLISPYSIRNGSQEPVPSRLEVHYLNKTSEESVYRNVFHPVSWVQVKNVSLPVTSANVIISGSMDNAGLGTTLPQNYKPASGTISVPVDSTPNTLLEKPYLHTDRAYYYSGEKIWFKGYISYASRFSKDTLSRSLYVDFVNAANDIVISDVFRIDNGIVTGDLQISPKLTKGDYVLKAYTSWGLNFGDEYVFTKPIKILAYEESVRMTADHKIENDLKQIIINTDKPSYHPREKISLSIAVLDLNGFRTHADLSVSVTDITQAVPGSEEHSIVKDLPLPSVTATASTSFPIQYGIDLKGELQVKGKPEKGTITIFQEKSKTIGFATADNGMFRQSLQLYDSADLFLQARNLKGKQALVLVDRNHPRPSGNYFPKIRMDVYASEKQSVIHSSLFAKATLLDEVTIRNKRIERPSSPAVIHRQGDFSLPGDWIRENDMPDLLTAITYKIPGIRTSPLRIGWFADEPMVTVDGVAINQPGEDPSDMIRNIPARSVKRVDVIKYSTGSIYGARGSSGVIAIITDKGKPEPESTTFDKSKLQLVKLKGYATPSVFESPDYGSGTADADLKDYRATIYWDPSVRPTANAQAIASFFAADLPTQYRIIVEGILQDGTPVRGEKLISVTNNP